MKTKLLLFGLLAGASAFSQVHDYAQAQHLSTYFLGAQRCGNTKSWIQPAGGPGCHTKDGETVNRDLSGGWHDCGDYIKFHVTGPYTALMNLYGYYKFPEVYPDNYSQDYSKAPGNGIPDILDEVKIETDYLIKCVNGSTIYWQIGDGNDHNSFNEPVSNSNEKLYNGTTKRPVFSATSGHSNAFGNAAAALALMSIVYKPYDATYAQQCLTAAQAYYTVGKTNAAVTADAVAGDGFYAWLGQSYSQYFDEMGMGAAMLYRATNTASYLTDANTYVGQVDQYSDFSYGSIGHLLYFEMYKITGTAAHLTKVKNKVNGYTLASCGYTHVSNWGSLRDAGNVAFLAALYHSESGLTSAYTLAKSNIDFILGTHGYISASAPANFSFLIGYNVKGGGYPKYPHHGAAFGKSSNAWGQYTTEGNSPGSVPFGYTLLGGLAGGPEASCSKFTDNINNYVSSEYCSYYNAAFTGAVAYINKIENNVVISTLKVHEVNDFHVFPNPTSDFLTINNDDIGADFEIIDNIGRIVLRTNIQNQGTVSVSELQNGVYYVKKVNENKVKIFIKH